jgi:hypothetical protein
MPRTIRNSISSQLLKQVMGLRASVNPPLRAAPPGPSPQDVIARLTATAAARTQANRICSASEVAEDIGLELARILAAFQTPEAVTACAGEDIPALQNYLFQVLRSSAVNPEGDNSPQALLDAMREGELLVIDNAPNKQDKVDTWGHWPSDSI